MARRRDRTTLAPVVVDRAALAAREREWWQYLADGLGVDPPPGWFWTAEQLEAGEPLRLQAFQIGRDVHRSLGCDQFDVVLVHPDGRLEVVEQP